ncbi:MAG TPA: LuxR C-terminal-related transcriptional regulator, partial [Actinocrinis sp.]|uniref:LuxR C-terminal-related transcriptional regulator n=1 Tax=Actinocrinis sp. TaxID=1920516 RepID=UPI002DDD5B1E
HTTDTAAHEDDRLAPLASIAPALRFGTSPLIGSADFMDLATLHEQPLWLAERLATLLERRAQEGPILLAIDDGQWCDPLTVFIMRVLPKRLIAAPVAWVLSTRAVPGGGPAELIVDAARPDLPITWLDLRALTEDAVLAIAMDRLGARPEPAVLRRLSSAHGNPFLAVQLLEGLFEPAADGANGPAVPIGLLDGVRRRVIATSQQCRELLRTAAVIGPEHQLTDVAELIGVPAARLTDPLVEAINAGLLADEGSVVRFRHELLRLAVYEDLPPSGRRALHRVVAEHLLARGRGYAAAAPHVLATAEPGDSAAVDVLRKAAHEVLDTMPTTAVTFIRQAFELVDANDLARAEIGVEVVSILLADRQFDEATRFADTLLATPLSAELRARARLLLLPRLWLTNQYAELLDRAADLGAPSDLAARLAGYRALAAAESVELTDSDPIARVLATMAAAEAADRERDYARTHALFVSAHAAAQGLTGYGAPEPGQLAQRALLALARLDDIDGALTGLGDSTRDDSWQAPQLALLRAQLAYGAGRVEAAAEATATAASVMAEMCDYTVESQIRLMEALLALLRGDNAPARTANLPLTSAFLADVEGDPRGAAELVAALRADHRFPWPEELLVGAAASAHHRGDADTVRAAAEMLGELAGRNPNVASVNGAKLLVDALSTNDFEPALTRLRKTPRLLLAARANEEHGRSIVDTKYREAGLAALDAAHDRYAELGATASAVRVQRLLQAAGARRRRWAPIPQRPEQGWDALTQMERRVALLIADGHTNRSAAEELVLSPSTINTHLRAVFRKLDVHSRVQLANLVLRGNDPSAR